MKLIRRTTVMNTAMALVACVALSACVSDTLSQQNTQPQTLASSPPSYDPAQRADAVADIRTKAAQPGSGELTSAYITNDGPTAPLTPQEQAAKIAELERTATANTGSVSDAELAEKQRSIQDLRNKAKTHYNSTVNSIQN